MDFLYNIYFGNELWRYILVAFISIIIVFFGKYEAKLIWFVLKRFSSKLFNHDSRESFLLRLSRPLANLLSVIVLKMSLELIEISEKVHYSDDKFFRLDYLIDKLLDAVIIFYLGWFLFKLTDFLASIFEQRAALTESKFDDQLVPFVKDLSKVFIIIFLLIMFLAAVFGVNVTALIGGLGIGGLALALAAQDSLANLLASFTIFIEKPFSVGDIVDGNGVMGTVEKVGFRSTRIRTLDKSFVTVPNRSLIDKPLNNITESTHRRARFQIGVLYGTSKQQMEAIIQELKEVLIKHENTNDEPLVRFFEFGDYSLQILVTFLVNTNDFQEFTRVKEEINFKILEIVQNNGSDFAFPTRTLHIKGQNEFSNRD